MRKSLIAASFAAATVAGATAGLAFGVPGISGAQSTSGNGTSGNGTNGATGASNATANAPTPPNRPDRSKIVSDVLAKLVTDGTINQAQADAITAALKAATPAPGTGGPGSPGGPGGPGDLRPGFGGRGAELTVVATAIGISEADLRTALQGGTTIVKVAQDHNVAVETVVAAVKADIDSRIDKAVTDGKLTADQATQMKADSQQHATNLVNGTGGPGGFGGPGGTGGPGGFGGPGGHGRGFGPGGQPPAGAQAPASGQSGGSTTN